MSGARLFTLDEATALLPRLRPLLAELRDNKRALDAARDALATIPLEARFNGAAQRAGELEAQARDAIEAIRRLLAVFRELGVEVKDLEMGLVDFPALRDGRVVYLCWRMDEERIGYWHELDAGFAGRQPL